MSSVWKIGTTSQAFADATTFASAGLCSLRRNLVATGMDTVSFEAPASDALTANLSYAFGSSYIIWKDAARWFYGRVVSIPRQGDAKNETRNVTLAGPWWYFQNATYMQSWRVYDINGEVLTNVNKCRVVLFQDADGNRCGSGTQAGDVVDWLISRGAPISKGTIDAGITLPYDERTNLSCADVMDTILRWTPDYVAWFDYSTSPYPTVHFRARSNLSAATIALTGQSVSGLAITPRNDLQKPGVYITYEKTHSVDDFTYNTVENDIAGNQAAIDCVYGVFDLQGSSRTYVKQKIVTENYPTANSKSWWKTRVAWLAEIADVDITIHDHSVDSSISSYSRILKDGIVQDWMLRDAVQGCIRAQADVVIRDSATNEVEKRKNVEIVAEVTATDASTHTYTRLTSFDSGEATPTGVAAALFNAWSILHFEGSLERVEDECSGTVIPGKKLRISGGRSEWTDMDALIQQTTEEVDSGTTTIQFGPPGRIEADSLVALFRAFRSRRYAWQASSRTTGSASGSGEVEMSGRGSDSSQSSGGGETQRLLIANSNEDGAHQIDLDPTAVAHADSENDANRVIKPREVLIGELSSAIPVLKLRQILASESYGDPIPMSTIAQDPDTEIDTLGSSTEGSETAATDTWTAGNESDHGLALWAVCRVVYNESGDKKIYAFLRKMTFDENGMLYSVSAETRVEVDAAVSE